MTSDRLAPLDKTGVLDAPLRRLRCSGCGYGASCRTEPDRCPMCGATTWNEDESLVQLDGRDYRLKA